MKYIIYIGVAALICWSVWYLIRRIGRQWKGECGCECGKDCTTCTHRRDPE